MNREQVEMEIRVKKSIMEQLSDDNIFKAEYANEIAELENELNKDDLATTIDTNPYQMEEEVDEEYEMEMLEELSKDYAWGTQSWDL